MATLLFKDGKGEWFEGKRVAANIASGWSPTDDSTKPTIETLEVPEELHPVRLAAKEAGIDGYEKKRIKTLEGELDELKD